jgi:antitoxin VapB
MNHHTPNRKSAASRARLFKSNRSQAVRIPKALAFPDSVKEVEIVAEGNTLIIKPVAGTWDEFFDSPPASDDFMRERDQGEFEERESLD